VHTTYDDQERGTCAQGCHTDGAHSLPGIPCHLLFWALCPRRRCYGGDAVGHLCRCGSLSMAGYSATSRGYTTRRWAAPGLWLGSTALLLLPALVMHQARQLCGSLLGGAVDAGFGGENEGGGSCQVQLHGY
jgi:hypothetical protein